MRGADIALLSGADAVCARDAGIVRVASLDACAFSRTLAGRNQLGMCAIFLIYSLSLTKWGRGLG